MVNISGNNLIGMTDRSKELTAQLKKYFGFDSFKGNQEAIIENLLDGNDTFVLMPTGGGKSLCYQLPSLLMEGTAIVVSPLIALMKNQVDVMRNFSDEDGIAHFINSSLNKSAIDQVKDDIVSGKTKLLYMAPESLTKEENVEFLKTVKISFYAIDEAHCISEWGHDFRPEYRKIRPIVNEIGKAPLIALTATATPKVQHDIQKNLGMMDAKVFKSSFNRPNLYYEVRPKTADVDKEIIKFIKNNEGKSGIIYCLSRKKVEELAEILQANGIKAKAYHAGMDSATRSQTQDDFLMEKIDVIVATIAFGMGIDKPDVRTVIHFDCPDSIEAYFQEAGRAGRDGKRAYAVLLWNGSDVAKLNRRIDDNFPPKDYINDVYEHLAYYYEVGVGSGAGHVFTFDIGKFCATYHFFPIQVDSALHLLENGGYIHYETDPDSAARVHILLDRNDLYRLDSLNKDEDAVMTALLRCYGGLFTDYEYIDEALIAMQAQLTRDQCYHVLKSLDKRSIISFIPQRKMPYISYLADREETVSLSKDVYEDRKKQYERRVGAMIAYATNDHICRSRQLLRYFGEDDAPECGHCDVCLSDRKKSMAFDDATVKKILYLLGDKKPHHLTDLLKVDAPRDDIDSALRFLVSEEKVIVDADKITIV